MASRTVSAAVDEETKTRLDDFAEDRDMSMSRAMCRLLDRGLTFYGYDGASERHQTRLQRWSWEASKACCIAATTVLVLSFTTTFAFAPFVAPLYAIAAAWLLVTYYEPAITIKYGGE